MYGRRWNFVIRDSMVRLRLVLWPLLALLPSV